MAVTAGASESQDTVRVDNEPISCSTSGARRRLRDVSWTENDSPASNRHTIAPLHQPAVVELGLAALRQGSLQALLNQASLLVTRTLDVDLCGILELGADGDELGLRAGVGWQEGLVGNVTVGPGLLLEHQVLSGVSVVIHGRDRPCGTEPWGALGAHSRLRRTFSAEDLNFLHAVANTLALAIECNDAEREIHRRDSEISELSAQVARLADDRRRMMADALDAEDRAHERISQMLHDEVLQSLLAARQDLARAEVTGTTNDEVIVRATEAVVAAIDELRNAVVALHPVTLERRGLLPALEATAGFHAVSAGFEVSLHVAPETAGACDQLIVSLAQELLSNVAQHAQASHVTVALRRVKGNLVFEVDDDGRGMDRARIGTALDQGHIGLASITRRIEALGGRLELVTDSGKGTRARVVLPAESDARSRAPALAGPPINCGVGAPSRDPADVGLNYDAA